MTTALAGAPWWQRGVVYQIYPLSFQDGNGDGIGDLAGIRSRLDHLVDLGADAIWLSPIHPSPMHDHGYDVADYEDVHPRFGTLAEFDAFVEAVHGRGLKLVLDLVANHTSHLHPWFVESRSSRDNPKRDWYIWRDPAPGGGPPNNWVSYFGSAWTLDELSGQYYFHQFRAEQPEVNYRNPDVAAAYRDIMRFWLRRGVDGFRADVIALMSKDDRFLDEPDDPAYVATEMAPYFSRIHLYTRDQPAVHEIIRGMRRTLDEFPDRVLIGELDPTEHLMEFYGAGDECHLPFNFKLILEPWDPVVHRRLIDEYDAALPAGAWPNWVIGNHDRDRFVDRFGRRQGRVAQMLVLTLRGTPIYYYGDEIGMPNGAVPPDAWSRIPEIDPPDPKRNRAESPRTPMQWTAGPNAGFCPPGVVPWMPIAAGHETINVEVETRDPTSVLSLVRRLIELRRTSPALAVGAYRSIDPGADGLLAYERRLADDRFLVVLNYLDEPLEVALPGLDGRWTVALSTELDRPDEPADRPLRLRANEGVILRAAPVAT
ncbi:MAG TPA: alpha-amylase family glycosyl hydrolase [Candidatus Limnocylindrales bacterium]|nr:alpha-amylase family glycosyl hydrolase [Candidatus Limnocylindrales bacterium]